VNTDQARISVAIEVPPAEAFELFTHEINRWWRRGPKYRNAGGRRGIVHLEARLDGRLFESFDTATGESVFESGRIVVWKPPTQLAFTWRNTVFAPHERTLVQIDFQATRSGTLVTVTHSGWDSIRQDHPARHGQPNREFLRSLGSWWGEQLTSLRRTADSRPSPRPPD
jgi:uncharacterized protein YndB with AHSA1/START domain